MPPVVAAIIAAAASTGATVYSVKKSQQAADVGAAAQREATTAQERSNAASLAASTAASDKAEKFAREQAANDQAVAEANRHGNYDQWASGQQYDDSKYAAREGRISEIGQRLGLPARVTPSRQLPGYVPLPGSISSINGGGASGGGVQADPKLQAAIAAFQQHNPTNVSIEPLTAALKQQGFNVDRFKYGNTPSNNELAVNGQPYKVLGGEGTAGAYWYKPGMDDSAPGSGGGMGATTQKQPYGSISGITGPMTPAYVAPRIVPGSLRAANF